MRRKWGHEHHHPGGQVRPEHRADRRPRRRNQLCQRRRHDDRKQRAGRYPNNISTIQQIQNYLASVNGVANPNAFYLIKTGDNDATYVNNQLAIDPNWLTIHPTYLSDVAIALSLEVARLQAAGARHIVVRNSYDSALFAGPGGDIALANAAAYARSKSLMTWEWPYLAERGVRFIPADNDSLFSYVVHNPSPFRFHSPIRCCRPVLRSTWSTHAPLSAFSPPPNSRTICSSTAST